MRVNESMKKVFSILLCLCMVLSYVPVPALAAEGDACAVANCTGTYAGGFCNVCGKAEPQAEPEPEPEPVPEHTHVYDGEAVYVEKDDSVHTVTRACTTCKEQAKETLDEPHVYAEGFCVCGKAEPVHTHVYVEGICECGAACEHIYAEGVCTVCSMAEPVQEPQVLTVTAWSWVDDDEIIDPDYMDAVIPGVSAENPIDWETLVEFLPSYITAQVNGEEVEIPVTWECDTFPEAATGGKYTLKAILPVGYVLGEGVTALEVDVDLGTVQQYAITPTQPANGDGSESNPYQITSADELYWFAEHVNAGNASACAKLMNNITVNENVIVNGALNGDGSGFRQWTPIGSNYENRYGGTFDGNGKTVSGLYFNDHEADDVGLFGYVDCCEIKNVGIVDSYFEGDQQVGGVAGYIVINSTVSNCYNTGTVSGNGYNIGGVVGYNSEGVVTNCYNTGTVNGDTVGGVVGLNGGTVIDCSNQGAVSGNGYSIGGVVGLNEAQSTLSNCYNTGIVSGGNFVGGVAGFIVTNSTVSNCYNTGTVSGGDSVGGVVGYIVTKSTVSNCYNTGTVSGNSGIGGVVGYNVESVVSNCYNTGTVSGGDSVGGVAGKNDRGTITSCYYLTGTANGGIAGADTAGQAEAKTAEQFASGEVTWLLNGKSAEGVWKQTLNTDTAPGFTGGTVYYGYVDCGSTEAVYTNTTVSTEPVEHNYDNGFCEQVSGQTHYEPATLVTAENCTELGLTDSYIGYYAITNAGQLYWIADKVDNDNANFGAANVVLTDNITVNSGSITANSTGARVWNPIGTYINSDKAVFSGTFDGNGKTVSGLYYNDSTKTSKYIALVACVAQGGTVKHVTLSNSYISGDTYTGGIAGENYGTVTGCVNNATIGGGGEQGGIVGENRGTVELCGNTGTITNTWCYTGGIVGYSYGTIRNCWNTGSISGARFVGGIVGAQDDRDSLTENCWSKGQVTGMDYGGIAGWLNGAVTVQNCYSDKDKLVGKRSSNNGDPSEINVQHMSTEAFASGEVAYLLRTRAAAGTNVWGQNLDNGQTVQTIPTFDGADVYYGYASCADTRLKYTNNASASKTPIAHVWRCTATATGEQIVGTCVNGCGTDGGKVTLTLDGTAVYDGTEKTVKAVGSLEGIDTLPDVTYVGDRINVGTFTASIKLGEAEAKVNFTIAKADLDFYTLKDSKFAEGLVYDGTEKALVTEPGSIDDGDIVFSLNPDGEYTTTIPVATEAGKYVVYWFAQGDKNHKDLGVPGETYCIVTIAAKPVTDATVTLGEYDSVYNGTAKEPGVASVIVDSMTLTAGKDYTVTYSNNVNAGTATVTIQGIGNFTGTVNKTFTISKAAASVTAVPTAKELTYTGEAQALVNAGTTADGKLVYSLSENGEFTETIPTGNNASDYMVWYYVQGDDNHADSAKASVKVTIAKAKAEISVATTPITVTYGETVELPTATSNFGTVSCDKTADELVNAGTYTVTYTVEGTDNYEGDSKTVTVTIEKLAVAEPTVTGTYTYTSEEQIAQLTGVESYMTIASGNKATNAGSYEVVITLDGNHKWADGSDGKLQWSIGKAQAQISVNTDPITVTYGETVTLPTAATNFGAVVCDKTAADLVNAGTYTVTYTVAGTDNYDGDTKSITVTVNAKAITVTAEAKSKTYGDADPKLTYKVEGLVNDDELTGELKRVAGENVGDYAVEQNTLTAGDNYTITYTGANLTINKRNVTITAKDQAITYGGTISNAEITSIGLLNGHSVVVTLTLSTANVTADGTITAGAAIITAGATNVTANYEITYAGGKLVIEPDISKIDGLTEANVTSANEADLKAVQAMMANADSVKDEWAAISTTCEDLIEKIEAVETQKKEVTDKAASFDAETVKSTDKANLTQLDEDIEALLDTENLTDDERTALETVLEHVNGMIGTLEETAGDSKEATDAIDALDPATVTSADKDELKQAIETIDELLATDHLTEDERKALEDAKAAAEALVAVVNAAQDITDTENTEKVEDVTAENVKPEDKEALEDAKADLEKALVDNGGNYTEEEKKAIQEDLDRINAAIETLEKVEAVTESVAQLPKSVEPDDEETAQKILDVKKVYDELTDHEKSLVDEDAKKKLDDLVAALIAYDIIKGDGSSWTKGGSTGLSFTANGSFSKFVGIKVDGKDVDEKHYEAKAGSTIITLKDSYLDTLSTGEHTVTVVYTDGQTNATFKINAKTDIPATGDNSNIMLYGSLLAVSLAGLIVLLLAAKKRKQENA